MEFKYITRVNELDEVEILCECQDCGHQIWVINDPAGVGAGYPYGWQLVKCTKCGTGHSIPKRNEGDGI